ncbi:MAG TPA: hypothetical protein VFS67_27720 [Polyangiaceae bacterium]|jgi:hypothetical protein|nr:hypothetical protein [Polyangiaceae bacterium]
MTDTQPSDPLLAASRLLGADISFLQLVELTAIREKATARLRDPLVRARLAELHQQFQQRCAEAFDQALGREQALLCLAALESAPLQRYLAARQSMAPALSQELSALQQRMGNLEI